MELELESIVSKRTLKSDWLAVNNLVTYFTIIFLILVFFSLILIALAGMTKVRKFREN